MPAPDFGMKLKNSGMQPDATWTFAPFQMFQISALGNDMFSTMSNIDVDGVPHAVSLDFDYDTLKQLVDLFPTYIQRAVEQALINQRPPWMVQFESPFEVIITARLGEPQSNEDEEYIPMVITDVEACPWRKN